MRERLEWLALTVEIAAIALGVLSDYHAAYVVLLFAMTILFFSGSSRFDQPHPRGRR